jgi:MoxR-like ATPase
MAMTLHTDPTSLRILGEAIRDEAPRIEHLRSEIARVIIGNESVVEHMLIALLVKGHVLIEGVPGVAKTTLVKSVAEALGLSFKRIQFTPDLLPSDLIGTVIFNEKTKEFEPRKGPIFAQIILADEINRAPSKVQSALLECMQERQVTLGSYTYTLDEPFFVFATQNPLEQEGTYRLPEAQIDRFMFKLTMGYPQKSQEREILQRRGADRVRIIKSMTQADIVRLQSLVEDVYVDERIIEYIVSIVHKTRDTEAFKAISCGASPRATIALFEAARAVALINKRHFVVPEDVRLIAPAVLRHRIVMSYDAEAEGMSSDSIVSALIRSIQAP